MKILARCARMIPAERCAVVIFPSVMEREAVMSAPVDIDADAALDYLEAHGVDEIECGWSGNLTVTGYETATTFHAEGDCPRCGQVIVIVGTD